jgi:hypothetical protein
MGSLQLGMQPRAASGSVLACLVFTAQATFTEDGASACTILDATSREADGQV